MVLGCLTILALLREGRFVSLLLKLRLIDNLHLLLTLLALLHIEIEALAVLLFLVRQLLRLRFRMVRFNVILHNFQILQRRAQFQLFLLFIDNFLQGILYLLVFHLILKGFVPASASIAASSFVVLLWVCRLQEVDWRVCVRHLPLLGRVVLLVRLWQLLERRLLSSLI